MHVIMNGSMWLGGMGGGAAIAARGVPWGSGGGGGGQLAPTPKAMLDPGLHGTYLDLS